MANNKKYQGETTEILFGKSTSKALEQTGVKNIMFSSTMFAMHIAVMFLVLFYLRNEYQIFDTSVRWSYVILALLSLGIVMLMEYVQNLILLYRTTGHFMPLLALKNVLIVSLFNRIGTNEYAGRVYETKHLNDNGIDKSASVCIPKFQKLISLIVVLVFGYISIILGKDLLDINNLVSVLIIAGLIVFSIYILGLMIMLVSKKVMPSIVLTFYNLLYKLKLIDSYEKSFEQSYRNIYIYNKSFKYFSKSYMCSIATIMLEIVKVIMHSLIIYLVCGGVSADISFVSACGIYASMVFVDFLIPLPFAGGLVDICFALLVAELVGNTSVWWALLIWRSITLYLPIIIGMIYAFCKMILIKHQSKLMKISDNKKTLE